MQWRILILSALFWIFYIFKRGSGLGCFVDVIRCKVGSGDEDGGSDDENGDGDKDDVAMQICE